MYTLKIFMEYPSPIPAFDKLVCVCTEFIDVTPLGSLDNHMTVDAWLFPAYRALHIMVFVRTEFHYTCQEHFWVILHHRIKEKYMQYLACF